MRLHCELYSAPALASAIQVFEGYASVTMRKDEQYFLVTVSADSETVEDRVAAELSNYALALTIEERRSQRASASQGRGVD
jgi:hypothetical protein